MNISTLRRSVCLICGFLALGIGLIGIIIPLLPTTPFLLLSTFLFMRGSTRIHRWFTSTKLYQKHVQELVEKGTLSRTKKRSVLLLCLVLLSIPFILVDNLWMRVGLIVLYGLKLYFIGFRIRSSEVSQV